MAKFSSESVLQREASYLAFTEGYRKAIGHCNRYGIYWDLNICKEHITELTGPDIALQAIRILRSEEFDYHHRI